MQTIHNDTSDTTYQTLIEFMKAAAAMNENSLQNPFLSLAASIGNNSINHLDPQQEQQEEEGGSEDESDGNTERLKRKRSLSQSSTETNKRLNSLTETNGGLQPFFTRK